MNRLDQARDNPHNKELSGWQLKLAAELDYEIPEWDIYWALQDDLQGFASSGDRAYLRYRVADRLFYQILQRANDAGLVQGLNFD